MCDSQGQCFSPSTHVGEMYGGTQLLVVYVNAILGSILPMESSGSFVTTEVAKHFIVQSSIF